MAEPMMLSTWSFAMAAHEAAWPLILSGSPVAALDAAEAACRHAEADIANPTVGVGGLPDASGRVSLDAGVMLSPAKRGAVAVIRNHAHPVTVARRVMERTPHTLLAGPDADHFAAAFEPAAELLTPAARAAFEKWRDAPRGDGDHPFAATLANIEELAYGRDIPPITEANHDTIGVLAMCPAGTLAAAVSTSGLAFKAPGRVGDSPLIGHGIYCEPGIGAAVATGHGELVSSVCGGFLAVECLRRGMTPAAAAREVLKRIVEHHAVTANDQIGVLVVTAGGEYAVASLRPGFRAALRTAAGGRLIDAGDVLLKQ